MGILKRAAKKAAVYMYNKYIFWYRKKGLFEKNANLSPKKHAEMYYFFYHHQKINWDNPVLFDEKLNVLKAGIYRHNDLIVQCTDKYRVREYVKSCGLEHILNGFYGVWEDCSEIDIAKLPDRFVIKRNNDCGGIVIVPDKSQAKDLPEKLMKLQGGTRRNYGLKTAEFHYQYIEPLYICEAYIGREDGSFPYDYKFYVMNGKAKYVLVCVDREKKGEDLRFMVDRNFCLFPVRQGSRFVTDEEIQQYKPALFEEMFQVAERLAEPFPFVRVDLYEYEGKILFGEMTFTPAGCVNMSINDIGQKIMGSYLDVSEQAYSPELKAADRRGSE